MLIACDFGRVGDRICPPSPRRPYSGDMTGAGADGGSPTIRPFDVRESDLGAQFTAFIDENRQHLLGSLDDPLGYVRTHTTDIIDPEVVTIDM